MSKKKKKNDDQPEVGMPYGPQTAPGSYIKNAGFMYLYDEVSYEKTMPIIMQINEYNLMPEGTAPERLILFINSPGGDIRVAWQLISEIERSAIPIVTVGEGLVASAGLLIFMVGHHRVMDFRASILSHHYSTGSSGTHHALTAARKEQDLMSGRIASLYRTYSSLTPAKIRRLLLADQDAWLTPKECLDYGLTDEVNDRKD